MRESKPNPRRQSYLACGLLVHQVQLQQPTGYFSSHSVAEILKLICMRALKYHKYHSIYLSQLQHYSFALDSTGFSETHAYVSFVGQHESDHMITITNNKRVILEIMTSTKLLQHTLPHPLLTRHGQQAGQEHKLLISQLVQTWIRSNFSHHLVQTYTTLVVHHQLSSSRQQLWEAHKRSMSKTHSKKPADLSAVIVHSGRLPRGLWKLRRIQELLKGRCGHCRDSFRYSVLHLFQKLFRMLLRCLLGL